MTRPPLFSPSEPVRLILVAAWSPRRAYERRGHVVTVDAAMVEPIRARFRLEKVADSMNERERGTFVVRGAR